MNEENEVIEVSEELKKELWKVPVDIDMIRDKSISNGALRLYLNLLGYARMNVTCFPSRKTLAEDIGVQPITIDRNKTELKQLGLLDWVKYIGKDGREHNRYTLLKYKPIQKSESMGNNNDLSRGTKMIPVGVQKCFGNNTKNKNTKSNSTTMQNQSRSSAPVEGQQHLTTLYNKYIPGVSIRKSDLDVLNKLDQQKLEKFLPYLPYFDDPYWQTTTKQPSVLPHVWHSLEKFVETFPNTAAFHKLCKKLKSEGVDVDGILEQATTASEGKNEIIEKYL